MGTTLIKWLFLVTKNYFDIDKCNNSVYQYFQWNKWLRSMQTVKKNIKQQKKKPINKEASVNLLIFISIRNDLKIKIDFVYFFVFLYIVPKLGIRTIRTIYKMYMTKNRKSTIFFVKLKKKINICVCFRQQVFNNVSNNILRWHSSWLFKKNYFNIIDMHMVLDFFLFSSFLSGDYGSCS
jgi:hypothetical protein